jgi:pimeloyl-ACP methyl ester carboxylesterase
MQHGLHLLRFVALLTAGWLLAGPAGATQEKASLELEPCRLEHPYGLGSVAARCGRLAVPEDYERPDGTQIELSVAVVPAIAARAKPDPLFLLAGGPGQGAQEAFIGTLGAFSGIRRERDLVMVDQRGTGGSNKLHCDFPTDALEIEDSPETLRNLAAQCLETLPGDPRFYTTSVAVRDLDAVRAALGYERINLYGGSYGTRVAQHYARRHPDRTRTVVLDGVVNPALALGASMALDADAALRAAFARCAAHPACASRYPSLEADFASLRGRLDAGPVAVRLPDPVTAEPREVRFTGGHLAVAARMLVYSDQTAALLPLFIHEAQVTGNLAPLAAQAEMILGQLQDALAYGMHNAVVCSEDLPYLDLDAVDREALGATFLGTSMLDGLVAMCGVWPRGVVDEDLKAPLQSKVPALLLSGEFDPVTPPAYAAAAAPGFADHAQVTFRGQGHIQLGQRCAQRLVRHFLDAGTAAGLDTSCADDVSPAPFFLNFNGGAP